MLRNAAILMTDHIFGGVVDYARGEIRIRLCLISTERLFLCYHVTSRMITALGSRIALCKLAIRQKIDGAIDEEYKKKIRRLLEDVKLEKQNKKFTKKYKNRTSWCEPRD